LLLQETLATTKFAQLLLRLLAMNSASQRN
jgi:hypothetical protein